MVATETMAILNKRIYFFLQIYAILLSDLHEEITIFVVMSDRDYLQPFSDYLFWDVSKESIDLDSNAAYIIRRVLELGQMKDWNLLVSRYGLRHIVEVSQRLRSLDPKALSFISAISATPKESP